VSTPLRIVHVSDSHLGVDVPYADEHWDAVIAHVAATQPDLVVHTGDVSRDGAGVPADLAHSRDRLAELSVPWLAIAGNHDIGDSDDDEHPVDDERRRRWNELFGALRWSHERAGWQLVGIDIQTLTTSSDAADEHWAWLQRELRPARPTALFLHRPLRPWGDAFDEPRRYVVEPHRARLADLVATGDVRLVASGHVHQHLVRAHDCVAHVWAPSSWAVIPDEVQPVIAAKQTGVIELALHDDGAVDAAYVRPAGMVDAVIGVTFPSPYDH
jgi:3',5'-cyclic AMP phosphodiesterase CpdA